MITMGHEKMKQVGVGWRSEKEGEREGDKEEIHCTSADVLCNPLSFTSPVQCKNKA